MARGNKSASTAATTAGNTGQTLLGEQQSLYGSLMPQLEAEATHPTGIDPTTMAEMKTNQLQTAGGSNAGSVGQGSLLAGRTRNSLLRRPMPPSKRVPVIPANNSRMPIWRRISPMKALRTSSSKLDSRALRG